MHIKRSFNFPYTSTICSGSYEEPEVCPICNHALKPEELGIFTYQSNDNNWHITALYLCKHCYQTFLTLHSCNVYPNIGQYNTSLLYVEPHKHADEKFDNAVRDLSPQFVKIYNQALAAESSGLNEIAGLGYRKALEFLIKDFCIHLHPDDSEVIKGTPLAQCIRSYIDNEQIKTLASRAVWIGNDEAHYIRKQEDRDIEDLKKFIKAAIYFVGMSLAVEDAASMSSV